MTPYILPAHARFPAQQPFLGFLHVTFDGSWIQSHDDDLHQPRRSSKPVPASLLSITSMGSELSRPVPSESHKSSSPFVAFRDVPDHRARRPDSDDGTKDEETRPFRRRSTVSPSSTSNKDKPLKREARASSSASASRSSRSRRVKQSLKADTTRKRNDHGSSRKGKPPILSKQAAYEKASKRGIRARQRSTKTSYTMSHGISEVHGSPSDRDISVTEPETKLIKQGGPSQARPKPRTSTHKVVDARKQAPPLVASTTSPWKQAEQKASSKVEDGEIPDSVMSPKSRRNCDHIPRNGGSNRGSWNRDATHVSRDHPRNAGQKWFPPKPSPLSSNSVTAYRKSASYASDIFSDAYSSSGEDSHSSEISTTWENGFCCLKSARGDTRNDQEDTVETLVSAATFAVPTSTSNGHANTGPHFNSPQLLTPAALYDQLGQPLPAEMSLPNSPSMIPSSYSDLSFPETYGCPLPIPDERPRFVPSQETSCKESSLRKKSKQSKESLKKAEAGMTVQQPGPGEKGNGATRNSKAYHQPKSAPKPRGAGSTRRFPMRNTEKRYKPDSKVARAPHRRKLSVPFRGKKSRLSGHPPPQSRPTEPRPIPQGVLYIYGFKVTIIDYEKMVFVIDMVGKRVCDLIRNLLNQHLRRVELLGDPSRNWRTLYTYTKMDLPCIEVPSVDEIIKQIMANTVRVVGEVYGHPREAAMLRPRSWKEPHILLYQRLAGRPEHTGVQMHYDGCHITWQLMLSDMKEYEGGGTYFRYLQKTIKLQQGQVLVHPGELYHKGVDITSGTRMLVVGFMDGFDPGIIDESWREKEKESHEANIVSF